MKELKPFLVETGKGVSLKYKSRHLYSSTTPIESVLKKVYQLQIQENTLLLLPSPCLGYGLRELAEKLPGGCCILCVEWDKPLWEFILQNTELPDIPEISYLQPSGAAEVVSLVKKNGLHQFRRVRMVRITGGYMLHPQAYTGLLTILEQEIQNYWQNKITLIHMAPLWIKNIFKNLNYIKKARSISSLHIKKPVVVTGAGASLENSIHMLKKEREKLTIITVDTAFPVLWQYGIKPDYIFIVESQLANLFDFITCKSPGIPVICDLTSYPQVIRMMNSDIYLFCSHFHSIKLFDRLKSAGLLPPLIHPLGSVGVAALYLAMKITTGPVFCTGLDFSYTKKKSHSRGAPVNDMMLHRASRTTPPGQWVFKAIKKRPLLKTTTREGRPLLTDLILKSYADKAKNLVSGRGMVYTIGAPGLDIGADVVRTPAEFSHLISAPVITLTGQEKAIIYDKKKVELFFMEEIASLDRITKLLEDVMDKGEKAAAPDILQKLLEEMDYLYVHFAETLIHPCYDKNIIFRILISAKHYKEILEGLTGTSPSPHSITRPHSRTNAPATP